MTCETCRFSSAVSVSSPGFRQILSGALMCQRNPPELHIFHDNQQVYAISGNFTYPSYWCGFWEKENNTVYKFKPRAVKVNRPSKQPREVKQ